ncbi:MAG: MFS transporter [Clostridiales bacterium]|nr:MFS transporter [Clostridiales bacterium]
MDKENTGKIITENEELKSVNDRLKELVDVDRRVISRKETIGYMLFDGSQTFNIDGHKELFNDSILKLSLKFQSTYNFIAGIWDVIDDLLVASIVEKTRTRWGKFRPYVFLGGVPLAVFATIYWLLPLMFGTHTDDFNYLPKLIAFAAIDMSLEFLGNFRAVGIGGLSSTLTPYPSDRRRLRAISSYFSILYGRLPDIVVEFMLDFIKNGIVSSAKGRTEHQMIRRALMIVGPTTSIIAGVAMSWFAIISKERVHQKIEPPKIRDSLRIVFTNRPVLMYLISNALGSFGTGLSTNDYYRQVLNMTTFETIAGIPSFFFEPFGFAKYNQLASRFSTRTLYMVSQVFAKTFYIPLWFYGRFLHTKDGKMFFQGRIPMLPVTALWECLYATFWGVKSISGNEISAECNDYIEWKYGSRNEATLSLASTFICKIPSRLNGILQPRWKMLIDYDQTAYTEGREQPLKAQKWIFAMATIIPAFLVLSSMIPMFWYNIDKEKRDRMYRELNERRTLTAKKINQAADGVLEGE